ncbi:hypothetical protein SteCoe_32126 [Stentor coeruleus]|uniref:Uncharacterized protein n=1 Tax=Stentor coeruleus TaxID=5963 RepID=A0A1R2AZT3_9CILI|nr:hypothetical protein SteCoe_32126 [Stentor coeruleus]
MGAGANCCRNRFQSTNEEVKCHEDPIITEEVMFMNPKALAESENGNLGENVYVTIKEADVMDLKMTNVATRKSENITPTPGNDNLDKSEIPASHHSITINSNRVTLSKKGPESLYQALDDEESKKIDIKDILMVGGGENFDMSILIEGVVYPATVVFHMPDDTYYRGEFNKDCVPHGRGIQVRPDRSTFVGYFLNGRINGLGRFMNRDKVVYQGMFISQEGGETTLGGESIVIHGKGMETWPNGIKYEGTYNTGHKEGDGVLYMLDGKYTGEFYNDDFNGYGEIIWNNGNTFKGSWKDGLMHGKGTFTWKNGKTYTGRYKYGEKHGKGVMTWPDKRCYEGNWKKGNQHGEGIYTFFDKSKGRLRRGRGEWENGERKRWLSSSNS